MIYLVLGMHKSGTTLVASALHESGIDMGEDFRQDAGYSEQKYEAKWGQVINDAMLGTGCDLLSLKVTSACLGGFSMNEPIAARMQEGIAHHCGQYADWGFKDPRSALTYRYWREKLQTHRIIVVYRDPRSIWRRYSRFINWSGLRSPFTVWEDYNDRILEAAAVADHRDVLYLCFDRLLTERSEWERLERFANRQLADVCDPQQSANRFTESLWSKLQYRMLEEPAGRRVRDTYRRLDRLRHEQVAHPVSDTGDG